MIDEPTFRAQSLNFLYAQFKASSMTDSWCVFLITSNDHEPLIAHPGSYDADRCIHRNDHGQPRGRLARNTREFRCFVLPGALRWKVLSVRPESFATCAIPGTCSPTPRSLVCAGGGFSFVMAGRPVGVLEGAVWPDSGLLARPLGGAAVNSRLDQRVYRAMQD